MTTQIEEQAAEHLEGIQGYMQDMNKMAVKYLPKLALAIITLVIGLWLINMVVRGIRKIFEKRQFDKSLSGFLSSFISAVFKILLFISVAGMIGVETTSFIALVGAMGLAIGMALQGSLGNFAGGVLILVFKPYKVGDLISAQGHTGHVKEIQVFNTLLVTPDHKRVILPNGAVANGDITNFSAEGYIRVDIVIGISYDADIKHAKEVAMEVMRNHPKVMSDPAPSVNVEALGDNSVNLAIRPFATIEDYWPVFFGIQEGVKYAFDEASIGIPYPQMDLHVQSMPKA